MLGTGYFLKIAKIFYSQRGKPMCSRRKNQFPRNRKIKSPIYKINSGKNFVPHRVHPPSLFCVDHQLSLSSIYSLSSNSLMRPVGWGGVRDGNTGLPGIPVTSSFQTFSAVCSAKILVFIQYIISIYCRSYGNPVQTLTAKDCKGLQTNIPKNVGSIKT